MHIASSIKSSDKGVTITPYVRRFATVHLMIRQGGSYYVMPSALSSKEPLWESDIAPSALVQDF